MSWRGTLHRITKTANRVPLNITWLELLRPMKTFVKRLFIRVCLQHGYHCAKILCCTHQLGCTVLVEEPLSLQIGKVLFSKDFVSRIVMTGLNMILSTSTTLKNQVAKNNFEKTNNLYSQYNYLGSHDRVHKAAVDAMKEIPRKKKKLS